MSDEQTKELVNEKQTAAQDQIGRVAPDLPDGEPDSKGHVNTLVVVPEFRLKLSLGNFDELFEEPASSEAGKAARLQCLGLFYRPLGHRQQGECLRQVWPHYCRTLHDPPLIADADALESLKQDLQTQILKCEGRLPEKDGFAKILFPGSYTYWSFSNDANREPFYEAEYAFSANRYEAEQTYYDANSVLGRIPLVATVEKKVGGQWVKQAGVHVYFQLIKPDDLPAFDENRDPVDQFGAPPLRDAPRPSNPSQYAQARKQNYQPDPNAGDPERCDPQVDNCHSDFGGKRGQPVPGHIFLTDSVSGFNQAHPGRDLSHKPFPVAAEPDDADTHPHAVVATTNDDGQAGVIFAPSRTSGDRYKLRVYIGPETLASDGKDTLAVKIDTGTFVTWRSVRLHRYVQHTTPAALSNSVGNELNAAPYNIAPGDVLTSDFIKDGLGTADYTPKGKQSADYEGAVRQFAKAYCELIVEPQVQHPEALSAAQLEAAMRAVITRITSTAQTPEEAAGGVPAAGTRLANAGINWDLDRLIFYDAGSPFTINAHTPAAYNALLPAGSPQAIATNPDGSPTAAERRKMTTLTIFFIMPELTRQLGRGGLQPGLVVVQGPYNDLWSFLNQNSVTSGIGLWGNGCFLWNGNFWHNDRTAAHPFGESSYNITGLAVHEGGHCYYKRHQPGAGAGGARPTEHDQQDRCAMSYLTCEAQFCGQCLFKLMGYDTENAAFPK